MAHELLLLHSMRLHAHTVARQPVDGFTLVEVILALAITGILLAGLILGYVSLLQRAEWSAHSLAAQSLALQRLEQTRAAKWDTLAAPVVDQLVATNFPTTIEILDIPIIGTNINFATNFTTITTISPNPPLRLIQVDCVWHFYTGRLYTNSVVTYRAPDQ